MTTTPTPTHASAVRGMERALREAKRRAEDNCVCGPPVDYTPDESGHASNCPVSPLARALAAWEQRPRAASDAFAVEHVNDLLARHGIPLEARERAAADILAWIDDLLGGCAP